MSKIALVNTVAAGGLVILLVAAAPNRALGQALPPGAAPSAPMMSAPRGKPAAAVDLLQGLTLTDDQKAKIDQIRADIKSRVATVANDKQLSPEVADAFRTGYLRSESVKILEVLNPEQRKEVRKRIAERRAAAGKPQYPMRPTAASGPTPPAQ